MLKTFLLIVVGLAGDSEHGKTFHAWGAKLAEASVQLGVTPERLVYLVDAPAEGDKLVTGPARREEITKVLDRFAKETGPEDVVFITLIGHGNATGGTARFNLPGPDMSAADFNALLKKVPARVVFVNTTSSSGPFVAELSGAGRTIVTATRNGAEQYATLFGGFFVDALTSEAADLDKNKRVSVLEAFNFAKAEVARAYEQRGLLATEHALLDDNGDKEGSQTPLVADKQGKVSADGKVASILAFGVAGDATLSANPKVRALQVEYREYEGRVNNLRLLKDSMPPEKYQAELESLLTAMALKNREIRAAETK